MIKDHKLTKAAEIRKAAAEWWEEEKKLGYTIPVQSYVEHFKECLEKGVKP